MSLDVISKLKESSFIVEYLEGEYAEEKPKHVLRLLRNFYDRVPNYRTFVNHQGILPYKNFQNRARYTDEFFKYITSIKLSEKDARTLENEYLKKLKKEKKKTLSLYKKLGMDKEKPKWEDYQKERRTLHRLPSHMLPPYLYDWRGSILGEDTPFYKYDGEFRDFKFTKKLLGSGGLADVYLVLEPDGRKDAMKLYHQDWKFFDPDGRMWVWKLVENVENKKDVLEGFQKFPKVRGSYVKEGRHRPHGSYGYWYLMDFVNGVSGERVLMRGNPSNELKKKSLENYAEMLNYLHSRDHVFLDNKWGALMIDGNNFSVIDFDLVTKCGEKPPLNIRTVYYSTTSCLQKQPQPTTKAEDIVGFAKIIDHLYVRRPLTPDARSIEAFETRKVYPPQRKQKLPKGLGDVVEKALTETEKVSISDFSSAIKEI